MSSDESLEATWFRFDRPITVPSALLHSSNVSTTENGQLDTVLFDNCQLVLQDREHMPSQAITALFEIPAQVLTQTDPLLGYAVHLRGFCDKTEGARGLLIIQIGGSVLSRSFDYGTAHSDSFTLPIFSFEQRPHKDSGAPIVPLPPLTIAILLTGQRLTLEDTLTLSADSIDISATKG